MDAERWILLALGLGSLAVAAGMAARALAEPEPTPSRRRRVWRLCFGLAYALLGIGHVAAATGAAHGPWIDRTAEAALVVAGLLWLARRRAPTGLPYPSEV